MSYSRKCFSPFAACCRRGAVIGIICIDKLSSGMINNHLFQSLSAVCICQHACAGYRYSRKFYANMRVSFLFNFPPPLIPFKSRNKTLKKKKEKNKQKMKNTAFFFWSSFQCIKESKKERERDSNHSNEGLSLLGPGVVCPGSLFLAPC